MAIRNGANNWNEGDPPQNPADPYVGHWHATYPGDACDTTPVTAIGATDADSSVDPGPCEHVWLGYPSWDYVDYNASCPKKLTNGKLAFQSFLSTATGIYDTDTTMGNGTSRPAFCRCDAGDPATCQNPQMGGNCEYARDSLYPVDDTGFWKRISHEVWSGIWRTSLYGDVNTTFGLPTSCASPQVADTTWNAFAGLQSDVSRFGLPGATSLTGILWSHVLTAPAPPPQDLSNQYQPLTTEIAFGQILHHGMLTFPIAWTPWALYTDVTVSGAIGALGFTMGFEGAARVVSMTTSGLSTRAQGFTIAALQALGPVAYQDRELIVADDRVAGPHQYSSAPLAILVDRNTTRVRAALVRSGLQIDAQYPTGEVPFQSEASLRSYSAGAGKLYSLEGTYLVSRDVPQTLAGYAPPPATLAVSGAIPFQPMAMVWDLGKLFVADRMWLGGPTGGGQSALRLVAIDPVTAIATELWRTQGTYDWQIANAYLTASRYGELVLSLNLTNGMADVASFRADDGQPIQSGSAARIAGPTVSDGSGFTMLIEQQMTDTTSNARLEHRERDMLLGGVCGTTWLRSVVGNQSGSALGNPAVECQ